MTVAFDITSGIVAALVGYYALKAYRISNRSCFLTLSSGFILLSSGFISHALILVSTLLLKPVRVFIVMISTYATLVSAVAELLAYVLIAVSYHKEIRRRLLAIMLMPISLNSLFCTISILLLFYIVLNQIMVYFDKRERSSLLLFMAFLFMLMGKIAYLIAILSLKGLLYVFSRIIYFLGTLSLLYMLHMVMKSEKAEKV